VKGADGWVFFDDFCASVEQGRDRSAFRTSRVRSSRIHGRFLAEDEDPVWVEDDSWDCKSIAISIPSLCYFFRSLSLVVLRASTCSVAQTIPVSSLG
jgi:hypothetical protein